MLRVAAGAVGLLLALGLAEVGLRVLPTGAWGRYAAQEMADPGRVFHQVSDDPALGYSLRPGASGDFQSATVQVNSMGCRGPEPAAAQPGVRRILGVGDSITFGATVDDHQTFVAVMQRELQARGTPNVAMNCGVSGYNARQSLRTVQLRWADFQPDTVVFSLFSDDFTPPYRAGRGPVDTWLWERSALWRATRLLTALLGRSQAQGLPGWATDGQDYRREALSHVRSGLTELQRLGVDVRVVVHPHLSDDTKRARGGVDGNLRWVREAGIEAFDAWEVYDRGPGSVASYSIDPQFEDPHPGVEGHRMLGEALAGWLVGPAEEAEAPSEDSEVKEPEERGE